MKLSPWPWTVETWLNRRSALWQFNRRRQRGKHMPDNVMTDRMPVREIESTPITKVYARVWHCRGPFSTFKDGKPHAVEAFGTKLVVFQGEDGSLNVLNAFCLHM